MHRKEWLLCIIILNQNNPRGARFSIAGSYAPAFFKSAQRDMAALWRGQSVLFFQRRQKSMGFVRAAIFALRKIAPPLSLCANYWIKDCTV